MRDCSQPAVALGPAVRFRARHRPRLPTISACLAVLLLGVAPAHRATASGPAAAVKTGLVILVQFPGLDEDVPREWAQRRFGTQLNDYVQEMSYGRVRLAVDVTERWHTLPQPVSAYRISPRNLEVDKSRVRALIADALDAVDGEVDVSTYDFIAIFLRAKLKDYGMIGLCGWPGMLGWGSDGQLRTRSGRVVKRGVAIYSYQAHLGTLFHDMAHILGGVRDGKRVVPCLYDHDLQARPGPLRDVAVAAMINMGFWDPMSCHYIDWGVPPPGLSSWTKLRLQWIDPAKVRVVRPSERAELWLGALEDGASATLVVRIPLSATRYYLVENRQPIGVDRGLPGHGVLIMRADDAVPECRHGEAPVKLMNADVSQPRLEGAAFDVPNKAVFVDRDNGVSIRLLEKVGNAYRIEVAPVTG